MTLTQAVVLTKKGFLGLLILIALGVASYTGYKIWYQYYYLPNLPPVIERPEMKFGTLPAVTFPPPTVTSSNYSYSLDTTTGSLPQFPTILKVYFIPQNNITLLAPDRAANLAVSLGFPDGPEIISPSEHRFTDGKGGRISINLTTGNFHFERPISTQSAAVKSDVLSNKDNLIKNFKGYLSSKGLLVSELDNGRNNVILPTNTSATTPTATVSLWPADFDKLRIVTSSFSEGLVKATIAPFENELQKYVKVDYTFWSVDQTTFSTYPLKTAQQAFDELKSGQGYITKQPPDPKVSLTSVYLAYYQTQEYSPYLQPVFVFEGQGFMALVQAVATQ